MNCQIENKPFWKDYAQRNFGGLPVADLICELQYKESQLKERIAKIVFVIQAVSS